MTRVVRLAAAVLLAAGALVVVGVTADSAQAVTGPSKDLFASTTRPIAHEGVQLYGTTYGGVARTVKLQYKKGGSWKTFDTFLSNSDGTFYDLVHPSKTRTYRYYSPKAGSLKAVTGRSRTLTTVKQRIGVTAANTRQCAFYDSEEITITVELYPTRPYREVTLHTEFGDVGGHQNIDGTAVFHYVPPNDSGTHDLEVKAETYQGSDTVTSKTFSYRRLNSYCL